MHANDYIEHPGFLLGLIWAFWLVVACGASVLCIPLAFFPKSASYAYRISRAILWGTAPLIGLYFLGDIFDPGEKLGNLLAIIASCVPVPLALLALVVANRGKAKRRSLQQPET